MIGQIEVAQSGDYHVMVRTASCTSVLDMGWLTSGRMLAYNPANESVEHDDGQGLKEILTGMSPEAYDHLCQVLDAFTERQANPSQ